MMISETISLLTSSASKRNVTLHFENKIDTGIVQGVPSYIQEIVYNLIDNAIRYNKEGGKVFVLLEKLQNGKLEFSVKDTGIGIPEEYQQRVFERFFRVDKSHSRETGGNWSWSFHRKTRCQNPKRKTHPRKPRKPRNKGCCRILA